MTTTYAQTVRQPWNAWATIDEDREFIESMQRHQQPEYRPVAQPGCCSSCGAKGCPGSAYCWGI